MIEVLSVHDFFDPSNQIVRRTYEVHKELFKLNKAVSQEFEQYIITKLESLARDVNDAIKPQGKPKSNMTHLTISDTDCIKNYPTIIAFFNYIIEYI